MGTVSISRQENYSSSYKSTWTFNCTMANKTVSGSTFTISASDVTMSCKYVYSGKAYGFASCGIGFDAYTKSAYNRIITTDGSAQFGYTDGFWFVKGNADSGEDVKMTSGTVYSMSLYPSSSYNTFPKSYTFNTDTYFNATNKTEGSIPLYPIISVQNGEAGDTFSEKDKNGTQFNRLLYNSRSRFASPVAQIVLNAPPTFTASSAITYNTNYIYAGYTTASVTVSNLSAKYGGDIESVTFKIGEQTATRSDNGTLSIALNAGGEFVPTVIVTDSRGQTSTYAYNPIVVNTYTVPSVAFDAERTTSTGVKDDEGTYAVVTARFTYTNAIATLQAPTINVMDEDGIARTPTATWYSTRASSGALSGSVTWANVTPTTTVYALISIPSPGFNTQKSYQISLTPKDNKGTGLPITQVLATAFYTVDFLAGGHGIAFGQASTQEGFWCNMDAHFNSTVDSAGDVNIASGKHFKINGTTLSASDVSAVPTTRTVNGKALSSDISLTASDVGLEVTTPTVSVSATTGTLSGAYARKYGKVVQLSITVQNSSSVASSGNVFTGTLNTTALRPLMVTTGGSFFGAHAINGYLNQSGDITIRNASSTTVTISGASTATVSFTYIVA